MAIKTPRRKPGRFIFVRQKLQNHHTVAKRVEAVFLFHRLQVGLVDEIFPGESRRHAQGRRVREVKVGNQAVNGFKFVSGIDKQIGPFFARVGDVVVVRKAFQRAGAGGAAGKHPLAGRAYGI